MNQDDVVEWIWANKEWLFSGLGIVVLGLAVKFWGSLSSIIRTKLFSRTAKHIRGDEDTSVPKSHPSLSKAKQNTRILFIDDDTSFKVVNILKNAGWEQTTIHKDIGSLDDADIIETDIFFIDINGVGKRMLFTDEGLGLAHAIKKRYPKKRVIIYSADPKANWHHEAWEIIDARLPKNADPYEFQQLVEEYAVQRKSS